MRTPAGTECRFYYEDYYRGREVRECRLIGRLPGAGSWSPALCRSCPVPGILRANACPNMALQARVVRRLRFWRRVRAEAYCTRHLVRVRDPHVGCGHCHEERGAQSALDLPVGPDRPPDRG